MMGRNAIAVGVVLLMVLSSTLAIGISTNSGLAFSPGSLLGSPSGVVAPTPNGASSHGPGHVSLAGGNLGAFKTQFFTNTPLPLAGASTRPCVNALLSASCPAYDQLNVSNDPTSVYTSQGGLSIAYTSLTNDSPCAAARPYSVSNIAFEQSRNNGSTWSKVQYLGSSDCSTAGTYPSAWQPSLAALGNGTLVLAYVEYNLTGANATGGNLPPTISSSVPPLARLVITLSYTNGATWTTPQVLNVSTSPNFVGVYFVPSMPSVATFGNTIYVAWERLGTPYVYPSQNSQISMRVSTSAGKVWSPVLENFLGGYSYYWSQNPQLMVSPYGEVFLAYDLYYYYSTYQTEVYVSTTMSNGTVWNDNYVGIFSSVSLLGQYQAPVFSMAWNPLYNNTLYLAFASSWYYGAYQDSPLGPTLQFWTSHDNGSSWSSAHAALAAVYGPTQYYNETTVGNPLYAPGVYSVAMAINPLGDVYVSALVKNESLCFRNECGSMTEVVTNTTNNGSSFSAPILVNGNVTPSNSTWFGEKTSIVATSAHLFAIYPQLNCPIWPQANCTAYPGSNGTQSQVFVSQPYLGTGLSLTYQAHGLSATLNWSVTVMGKSYQAGGNSSIVVSGIPSGSVIEWVVPALNVTPTKRAYPLSQTLSWMTPTVSSGTDVVSYTDFFPMTMKLGSLARSLGQQICSYYYNYTDLVVPPYDFWQNYTAVCIDPLSQNCALTTYSYWYYYGAGVYKAEQLQYDVECVNLAVNTSLPLAPGVTSWLANGTLVNISEASLNYTSFILGSNGICSSAIVIYDYCDWQTTNVSFVSWTGVGSSSVTSNASTLNLTINGPATETLNVIPTGSCTGITYYYNGKPLAPTYADPTCTVNTASVAVHETGLPSGLYWGVTLSNATGSANETVAAPASLSFSGIPVGGQETVSPWTILTSTPGMEWVGKVVGGDLILPGFSSATTVVNYTMENVTAMNFNISINETGLPGNSSWGYHLESSSNSVNVTLKGKGNMTSTESERFGSYNASAISLAYTNLTGYYIDEVIVTVHNENTSTMFFSGTATFNLTGDANVTFVYLPEYWLQTGATGNGTVTPGSGWIQGGATVVLQAIPAPGSYLVGWTGSGLGSTGQSQRHSAQVTIRPLGPVTEIAVFAPSPPPAYTATVQETGLPTGQVYTVLLGGIAYSGSTSSWTIQNLSAGSYTLVVPFVYDNVTIGARYTPSNVTVAGWSEIGSSVSVGVQNGTISIGYNAQFILELSTTPGGTITPAAGSTWVVGGSSMTLTAVPDKNYHFVGWSGSGIGARNASTPSLRILVDSEVLEAAQFAKNPPSAPATYTLSVVESGLPASSGWNVSIAGAAGMIGTSSTLVVSGLNGTYTLVVPIVTMSLGERWVPAGTGSYPVSVNPTTGNTSYAVNFTEQFLVTIAASGQGNATPSSSEWVNAGASVQLQGVPGTGWILSNWTGNGSGSYTGSKATTSISVTGPVSEVATFIPAVAKSTTQKTQTSSTAGLPLAVGLLVVLLVVGLLVGMVLARRRRPPTAQPAEAWEASPSESASGSGQGQEGSVESEGGGSE